MPEHAIQHLIYNPGGGSQDVIIRVEISGYISRSLGIWPDRVYVRLVEPEYLLLPSDLGNTEFKIRIGTTDNYIDIDKWRYIDVQEVEWGSTPDNSSLRTVMYQLTLEDIRWQITGDRGGVLLDGLLNPTRPDGQIYPTLKVTNSQLVQKCIDVIPLTFSGPLPTASLDAYDPPAELEWYGVHAPTELQRLLELTRHGLALNQDGTYSIVRLLDPQEALSPPDIEPEYKLPGNSHWVTPNAPGKCLIASCPTRKLIQRKRTLGTLWRNLQWVGVDTDGSILPLTDLSWWPPGKTPIQVVRNNYIDVADNYVDLAKSCIFKMLRLHENELLTLGTLVRRLVTEYTVFSDIKQPLGCHLMAKACMQDKHNKWFVPTVKRVIEGVNFDVETGVISVSGEMLISLDAQRVIDPIPHAAELFGDDVEVTFCHYPNAGDYTDYFMVPYEYDADLGAVEITTGSPVPDALADPAHVPVYRFDFLQAQYYESMAGGTLQEYNITDLKVVAQKLAAAILVDQMSSEVEIQQYDGLHNVDPNGCITQIVWDPQNFMTTCHLKQHIRFDGEYSTLTAMNRQARGGVSAAPVQPLTRGALSGRSGSAGAASGATATTRQAVGSLPEKANNMQMASREFMAKLIGTPTQVGAGKFRWSYQFTEVYKNSTAYGSSKLVAPAANPIGGDAGNMYEIDNSDTGMTGIGITVEDLAACGQEVIPVSKPWVFMHEIKIYKTDGTMVTEYWFNEPNPVGEISA